MAGFQAFNGIMILESPTGKGFQTLGPPLIFLEGPAPEVDGGVPFVAIPPAIKRILKTLTRTGSDVTLSIPGTEVYDKTTLRNVETGGSTETRKGVMVAVPRFMYGQRLRKGGVIETQDRLCYMDAVGSFPTVGATITRGSDVFEIIDIDDISPAGIPLVYVLVVRK